MDEAIELLMKSWVVVTLSCLVTMTAVLGAWCVKVLVKWLRKGIDWNTW